MDKRREKRKMGTRQKSSDITRESLISMKENLKDRVTDPQLNWKERMKLYRQIQIINEQIDQLFDKIV